MTTSADIILRVRTDIGDLGVSFLKSFNGGDDSYQVGVRNIDDSSKLVRIITSGASVTLVPATDYVLDLRTGLLSLVAPVPVGSKLVVSGTAFAMFSDTEVQRFVDTAVRQHFWNRTIDERYRDSENGFIKIRHTPITLDNMPVIEQDPVAILAIIEALWAMLTDASTDVDISTAEGTHLARGQRFEQLERMIDDLTARYQKVCSALGVGLYRIEVSQLRLVAMSTQRLVPIFVAREYDEYGVPRREIPHVDVRDEDTSGVPSPIYGNPGY